MQGSLDKNPKTCLGYGLKLEWYVTKKKEVWERLVMWANPPMNRCKLNVDTTTQLPGRDKVAFFDDPMTLEAMVMARVQYAIPLDIPFHLFSVFGSLFGFLLSSSNTGIRAGFLKALENHLEKNCWYKGKGPIQCRFCKMMGHIEKNCRKKQGQTNQQQANCVEDGEEPSESLFMVSQGSCSYDGGIWLVDSGCTSHMCKEEKMFCDLDKTVKIRVTLGNGEVMQSQGKGSVTVATRQGTRTIHNVLFVPGLSQNLLSVAQMISHGYTVMFKKKICFIYDLKGKLLAEVEMTNNTFPLHWYKCYDVAMHVTSDESFLWHRRFGHFNFSALKLMSSRGYIKDLPLINDAKFRTSDGEEETEFRDSTDAGEGQSPEVESPPDSPVRKYKSLTDVYERCNLVMLEPEEVLCSKGLLLESQVKILRRKMWTSNIFTCTVCHTISIELAVERGVEHLIVWKET
ncbi:Retrovirus-related Pol polyprotein from transposon TNT 1-94 [Senna tora]|uniref:Retrovirus-related Pol polyprotein from transposon TNT 1-94 n=1 Tax=Senna tora TaxID=362788 RepID=A0A835CFT5_9FABA|nr:Retrovirus-related Pol polyprotein from transposon TNT 1-94 [Senna tora]